MTELELNQIADRVAAKLVVSSKDILTMDEVSEYTGLSKSHIYKLTMNREIPHYKPNGKFCYFNRKEVEAWLQRNSVATNDVLQERAREYVGRNR